MKKPKFRNRNSVAFFMLLSPLFLLNCSGPAETDSGFTTDHTLPTRAFSADPPTDPAAGTISADFSINIDRFDAYYDVLSVTPAQNAVSYRWMVDKGSGWNYVSGGGLNLSLGLSDDPGRVRRYCRVATTSGGGVYYSNVCTVTDYAFDEDPYAGSSIDDPFEAGDHACDFVYRRLFNTFGEYFRGEDIIDRRNGNTAYISVNLSTDMTLTIYCQTQVLATYIVRLMTPQWEELEYLNYYDGDYQGPSYELGDETTLEPVAVWHVPVGEYIIDFTGLRYTNTGAVNDLVYMIIQGRT